MPLPLGCIEYEATAWPTLPHGSLGEAPAWPTLAGGATLPHGSPGEATLLSGGATLPHGTPWCPLLSPCTEGAGAQWQALGEAGSPYELTPFASREEGGEVASSAWLPKALMDEM